DNPVDSAAISPDGKYLAYSDTTGLYLKLLQTGETHAWPLPKGFSAHIDSWFPDSAHVLVDHVETAAVQPSLWSASVLGGEPRKLADDAQAGVVSPDGSYIAFIRVPPVRGEIWVMRSDGEEQVKVVPYAPEDWLGRITWSPDGRNIAYIRRHVAGAFEYRTSIEVSEWRSERRNTLLSQEDLGSALCWLPDGRLVYTRAESATNQRDSNAWVVRVDKEGRTSGSSLRLTRGIGLIAGITATADGGMLVFGRTQGQSRTAVGTLSPDGSRLLAVRPLTLDENQNQPFAWTPDSKSVVLSSDRNGTFSIFKQAIDQPLPELLATGSDRKLIPRLTPDGSEVVYLSLPGSTHVNAFSAIAAVPLQGGASHIIVRGPKISTLPGPGPRLGNVECARLPSTVCVYDIQDGDQITFFQLHVKSRASSELSRIDTGGSILNWGSVDRELSRIDTGGRIINWGLSPDGSKLATILHTPTTDSIQIHSLASGETHDVTVKGWSGLWCVDWAADGNSLYVTTAKSTYAPVATTGLRSLYPQSSLLRVALDGSASLLREGESGQIMYAIPSPDGHLLAIREDVAATNVWAIENF
ncbi:MAG TPA: hypothetical protein VEG30_09995, partial [Terriglobales bacterium]|nr:hypothetical protein [Terriglobales bacterium]